MLNPIADYSNPEKCVIGGLFNDPNQFPQVHPILPTPEFFESLELGFLWSLILKQAEAGEAFDAGSIAPLLSGEDFSRYIELLGDLQAGGPICQNLLPYAEKVRRRYIERRTKAILSQASAAVGDDHFDPNGVLVELEKLKETPKAKIVDGSAAMNETIEIIEKRSDPNKAFTIPSGFPALDELTGGGWGRSNLIILAARPGMGKTSFALCTANNVARDAKKVFFISLEMSHTQIMERTLAMESGVAVSNLHGKKLSKHQVDLLEGALIKIETFEKNILVNRVNLTLPEILPHCRDIQSSHGALDLVVVDYLQMINCGERMQNREREISTISGQLKNIAKTLNVPVIALSQLNRAVENRDNKKPGLADLRDSGSIEQDADQVLFMYRESYYNPNVVNPNECEIMVAKNRHGACGSVFVNFDPTKMRFTPK